jgi:hypothetical protein
LLSFTAGKVSAQIGPASDALPWDRLYVASITASIPGYETKSDIEKVRALRLYVYQHTPVGKPLVHDQVIDLPLSDAYAVFAKGGGVYCGGTAIMLSRVYKAAGFNSWLYDFGEPEERDGGPATHETTLVEVDGDVIIQDAYLNYEYVDAHGKPIPFLDVISRIVDGTPPTATAGVADRVWRFNGADQAEEFAGPYKDAVRCQDTATGVSCNAIITLSGFLAVDSGIPDFLEGIGWPRQIEYLMLYPIALVSLYSDGVVRGERLLDDLKRRVRDRVKMHNFAERTGLPRQMEYLMRYPVSLVSMYSDGVARAENLLDGFRRKLRDRLTIHSPKGP